MRIKGHNVGKVPGTTPVIQQLIKETVQWAQARVTTAPWTAPTVSHLGGLAGCLAK